MALEPLRYTGLLPSSTPRRRGFVSPLFSSISGIRTRRGAPKRRLAERAVHRQPLPLDPLRIVVGEQPAPPELQEDPRLSPLAKRR
jgi:hypothetical protein